MSVILDFNFTHLIIIYVLSMIDQNAETATVNHFTERKQFVQRDSK